MNSFEAGGPRKLGSSWIKLDKQQFLTVTGYTMTIVKLKLISEIAGTNIVYKKESNNILLLRLEVHTYVLELFCKLKPSPHECLWI